MTGKFDDETTEALYREALEGLADEESRYGDDWHARLGRDILTEDSQGFVTRETFMTVPEAQARFAMIDAAIEVRMIADAQEDFAARIREGKPLTRFAEWMMTRD